MKTLHVLGLSGSLRAGSHNTSLLRAARLVLAPDARLEIYEGLRDVPPFDADLDGERVDEAVRRLRSAIAIADGVLIATPEFNGSIPGVLKNALDWASRPFADNVLRGKPTAVLGASIGVHGASRAQADMRKVLTIIGADVIERELAVSQAHTVLGDSDEITQAEVREAFVAFLGVLAARLGAAQPQPA